MKIVQCWDDGVSTDIKLTEILRKYNAKATFNLNPGLHSKTRSKCWEHKGLLISKLGWDELKEVYDGFMIANHTLNHPRLEELPMQDVKNEIEDGRKKLQDFFNAPILGFAYPFGSYSDAVIDVLGEVGHIYGRTTKNVDAVLPADNPLTLHSNCHFLSENFWECYEKAKESGVFYFWGHSYEMYKDEMRKDFEEKIKNISADKDNEWVDVIDLFIK